MNNINMIYKKLKSAIDTDYKYNLKIISKELEVEIYNKHKNIIDSLKN